MNTLVLDAAPISSRSSEGTHSRLIRAIGIYGRRLARKLIRKTKKSSTKGITGLSEAPHLKELLEEDIDIEVAQDIERIIKMKCLILLENFGPTELVNAAIQERWNDIMSSLRDTAVVGDEIRVTEQAVNRNFSRIMGQIASRLLALQSPSRKIPTPVKAKLSTV